jgi:hypothetical protein
VNRVPTGTELARPFIPAKDFHVSKLFYEALGFQKVLDADVAIFNAGSGGFILQPYYRKEWAENCMMQLMVDDLDAWWEHIVNLDLGGRFGVSSPQPPAVQPWPHTLTRDIGIPLRIPRRRIESEPSRKKNGITASLWVKCFWIWVNTQAAGGNSGRLSLVELPVYCVT